MQRKKKFRIYRAMSLKLVSSLSEPSKYGGEATLLASTMIVPTEGLMQIAVQLEHLLLQKEKTQQKSS